MIKLKSGSANIKHKGKTIKFQTGGVQAWIKKVKQDIVIQINVSSVGRHSIGPWKVTVFDGDQAYLVSVAATGGKDEAQ